MTLGNKLHRNLVMVNSWNVKSESELYEPMRLWLQTYIEDNYKGFEVITIDSHGEILDSVLRKHGISNDFATGIGIKIDVLGIAQKKDILKLFFVEAKKTSLNLHDLGQLLIYCKLIDPEEAFLMSSSDLGNLDKLLNVFRRRDLLDFGDRKKIKQMKIAIWNLSTNAPEFSTIIPKT